MCGLVGVAGEIGHTEDKVFRDLLIIDSIRGPHSTGALFVSKAGHPTLIKTAGDPFVLLENTRFATQMRYANRVLLGHNRYATKGAVNKANAHPFEFDTLIGAHNGTLTGQYLLDDHKDFAVDSENLYYHMDKHGVQATAPKLMGAYALTWYDKNESSVNFLRNFERPLYYTFATSNKTMFWASEPWMLTGILGKHKVEHTDIIQVEVGYHYKMVIEGKGILPDMIIEKVTPYSYKAKSSKKSHTNALSTYVRNKVSHICGDDGVFRELQEHLGQEVYFSVVGFSAPTGNDKNGYYLASMCAKPHIKLRIITTKDSRTSKKIDCGERFSGTVNRINKRAAPYGVIANASISIVRELPSEDDEDDSPCLLGYGGALLTEQEWEHATSGCCAWCSSPAIADEHTDYSWVDDNTYVCGDCSQEADVKQYLLD